MKTIYVIQNAVNGKVYVGSTSHFIQRKSRHKQNFLKNNYKKYSKLYPAMRRWGWDNFIFHKICQCSDENGRKIEALLIRQLDSFRNGYNCTDYGGGGISFWTGKKRDKKTREKISKSLTGKTQSEKTKAKRSVAIKKARAKHKDKWLKKRRS